MKYFAFFLIFSTSVLAQQVDQDLLDIDARIRDTSLSSRCQQLIRAKNKKKHVKRRMSALIRRIDKTLKRTSSKTRQSPIKSLNNTRNRLKSERSLIITRIKVMEEEIIRAGCPSFEL